MARAAQAKINRPGGASLSKRKKDLLFVALMLAVPILHFLVFWLYVNFNSILMAFQTEDTLTHEVSWSIENWKAFFRSLQAGSSGTMWTAIKNTLISFCVQTFIAFPISIICCYILFKKVPGHSVWMILFFLPSLVSGLVLVLMFRYSIDFEGPVFYWGFMKMLGHPYRDFRDYAFYDVFNGPNAFALIQVFDVWSGIGISIVTLTEALYRIPKTIFESARLDGANIFREFFQIVLPLMWPTISTYLTYKVASLFLYSGPILLFDPDVKNGTLWTLGYWIFYQIKFTGNYYYAATVGLFFTLIGLPIILLAKHFLSLHSEDITY